LIVSAEKAKVGTLVTRMSGDRNAKEDRIMKPMIGKISILVLAAGMLVLSCAQEEEKVTLMLGGAPAEMDYWEEIIADFSSRTGIPVELMRQPTDTDQRRQSLLVPLKAGESDPDVFLMDIIWIGQFAASDWLEPLDPLIIRDGFDLDPFFGGIIEFADMYEGQTVAMPVYIDAGLLYFRKDLLVEYGYEGPPDTWAELVEMSLEVQAGERIENPGFWGYLWQGAQYEGLVCTFLEFAASNGGLLVDPDGRLVIDREENVEALRFMRGLISDHGISPPNTYTEMKEEEVRSTFQSGNALFERNWPYAWGLHQAEDSPVKGKVGIGLLPKFEGGRHAAALGGWHVGISKSSNVKDGSWDLVKFIVSREAQLGFALRLGWNPARRDLYDAEEITEEAPHLVELKAVFETAIARPNVPYYSLLSRALQQKVNAALSGSLEPEDALEEAQAEALEIVERYGR
jgi:multiple sugar transport system substrate-binding protein